MPGRPCFGPMQQEFRLKNLGFGNVHPARFSDSQWQAPAVVYLAYRLILAAYCIFWLIYAVYEGETIKLNGADIPTFAFLTTWTYFVLTLYLVVHFVACVVYTCDHGRPMCGRLSCAGHRRLFHELHDQPSLWGSRDYAFIPGVDSGDETEVAAGQPPRLSCLIKIVWILYNVASTACLMVSVVFWTLLWPQLSNLKSIFLINFQLHGVTSIIIIIEHLLSAVPWRLLHIVYPVAYGVLYVVFSGIYYAVDHRHVLYPNVLDWSQPGKTVVVIVCTVLVVLPLLQLLLFGIYKLRLFIYDRLNPEQ